jgi:hypothetical protein
MSWHLYIAKARTGRYYTGITTNPDERIAEHNEGKGSKFAINQGSFELVYASPSFPDMFDITGVDSGIHNHMHLHYSRISEGKPQPVSAIIGKGGTEFTQEVNGTMQVLPTPDRTTLHVEGPSALKINGSLVIGG